MHEKRKRTSRTDAASLRREQQEQLYARIREVAAKEPELSKAVLGRRFGVSVDRVTTALRGGQ